MIFLENEIIIVTRSVQRSELPEWKDEWNPTMDNCIGKLHKIISKSSADIAYGICCICLHDKLDCQKWYFPPSVLVRMTEIRKTEDILKEWI